MNLAENKTRKREIEHEGSRRLAESGLMEFGTTELYTPHCLPQT